MSEDRVEEEARTAMITESEMGHVHAYRMLKRLQSKLPVPGKVLLVSDGTQVTWRYRYGDWQFEINSPLTTYANDEQLSAHANFLVVAFGKQMRDLFEHTDRLAPEQGRETIR